MKTEDIAINRPGWFALMHRDGWWVGTDKGVTCYAIKELAKAALTIVWQRDGGTRVNFRVVRFRDPNVVEAGEYTPIKSAEQALKDYK